MLFGKCDEVKDQNSNRALVLQGRLLFIGASEPRKCFLFAMIMGLYWSSTSLIFDFRFFQATHFSRRPSVVSSRCGLNFGSRLVISDCETAFVLINNRRPQI
jgi:hypothetical protein